MTASTSTVTRLLLGVAAASAWLALAEGRSARTLPMFCNSEFLALLANSPEPLRLTLLLNPPSAWIEAALLMTIAMMVPLSGRPLRHLQQRSLAERRARASFLFLAGYIAVWTVAGLALQASGLLLRALFPQSAFPSLLTAIAAAGWQASPAKQHFLNRCHARPSLAAYGLPANRDALVFGITQGTWCVGACWSVMLVTFTIAEHHALAMAAVALFIAGERLNRPVPPRWQVGGPARAGRILVGQARLAVLALACRANRPHSNEAPS